MSGSKFSSSRGVVIYVRDFLAEFGPDDFYRGGIAAEIVADLKRYDAFLRADDLARRGLCLIPEGRGIFPNLTVRENLWMMTHRGQDRARIEERSIARFPQLAKRIDQTSGTLSGGQQQMLAMARGLATDPALLVLDELSMGLAPIIVDELYATVAQVAAQGTSVLLVEQFARIVIDVAHRAAVMVQGRVVETGRPHDIEERLSQAYLGG